VERPPSRAPRVPSDGPFIRGLLDRWSDHFALDEDDLSIQPRSEIGEVTIRIFGFNTESRLLERRTLRAIGRYPTAATLRRIRGAA
jgi:hypothetical protein